MTYEGPSVGYQKSRKCRGCGEIATSVIVILINMREKETIMRNLFRLHVI